MQYDALDQLISRSIRRQIVLSLSIAAIFMGGFAAAANWAEIHGAVMSSGKIIVLGRAKQVEHPDGGLIADIVVSEGDKVEAGQLLFRLDGTVAQANLGIIENQLLQLLAQESRLLAEQANRADIEVPGDFTSVSAERRLLLIEAQKELRAARAATRVSQKAQLARQISQLEEQISALKAQRQAVDDNIALVDDQLGRYTSLNDRGLIMHSQLISVQRERASLGGSQAALTAEIIETQQAMAQAELKLAQIDETFYESVLTELDLKRAEIAKLAEERVAAQDKIRRLDIRAPMTGSLHELNIHTIGSVAAAGETLVSIIPDDDELIVEAKLSPADIDQVHRGQNARIRLSSLSQRVTPELLASVIDISADLTHDPQTNTSYYLARLRINEDELGKVGKETLKPGMPAEVFVQTEARSILSYLIKPITDQITHAMREA